MVSGVVGSSAALWLAVLAAKFGLRILARILHATARVLACSLILQTFLSQSTGHTSMVLNRKKACKNN